MFRKFRIFQQQRLHVGRNKPQIESAGAVDVSDAGLAVDEEDAEDVEKGALGMVGIGAFVDGLVVGGEDGGEGRGGFGGGEAPFAAGKFVFTDGFGVIGKTLGRVVVGVEAQADKTEV